MPTLGPPVMESWPSERARLSLGVYVSLVPQDGPCPSSLLLRAGVAPGSWQVSKLECFALSRRNGVSPLCVR